MQYKESEENTKNLSLKTKIRRKMKTKTKKYIRQQLERAKKVKKLIEEEIEDYEGMLDELGEK